MGVASQDDRARRRHPLSGDAHIPCVLPLDDARIVKRILERQFPHLAPARVAYRGAGMDNTAFDVNKRWIFRFPMRKEVEQMLLVERAILPALASRVEVLIPEFEFTGKPDADFPFHFVGYVTLPGLLGTQLDSTLADWNNVAEQLGRFLTAVHAFPVSEAERLGAATSHIESHFEEVRATALELLPSVQRAVPALAIEWLRRYLEDLRPLPRAPWRLALVHNDLAAEHVLLAPDGSHVTGVIDWGDVAIADPTVDFVGLHAWRGDEFVRAVLRHYDGPVDERVLDRLRPWSRFRVIQDIEFGFRNHHPEIVRMAAESIASGQGR